MRLPVALHRGLVKEADNGWVGRATVAVHRLLDSPPLREALADRRTADWALGVADVLYADVLADRDDPPPAAFRPVTVSGTTWAAPAPVTRGPRSPTAAGSSR